MSGVLWWGPLLALASTAVLLAAVLVTPVKLGLMARAAPEWQLRVVARMLGGLTPPILIHDSARRQSSTWQPLPAKPGKRKRPSRQALAKVPRVMMEAPHLLLGLLRPIHLERLAIDADVGFADYADTGQLFGLLAPAIYCGSPASNLSVVIRPDFSGSHLSGEVSLDLSFIPIAFVPPGARFAWRAFGPFS